MVTKGVTAIRSCREFTEQKIEPSVLQRVVSACEGAPTAGNLQSYAIITTQDPARLRRLAKIHLNQRPALTGAAILTFCVDVRRLSKQTGLQEEFGFFSLAGFQLAFSDAVIASWAVCLEAHAEGISHCYLGSTFYSAQRIADFLECPRGVVPAISVALGYKAQEPKNRMRFPTKQLLHSEVYSENSRDSQFGFEVEYLNKYFGELESIQEMDIKRPASVAEFISKFKYPKIDLEYASKNYLNLLKQKGFFKDDI